MKKIFSVEPKPNRYLKKHEPLEMRLDDGDNFYDADGIILNMFVKEKPNVFVVKSFVFEHPHRLTCNMWMKKIREQIPSVCLKNIFFHFKMNNLNSNLNSKVLQLKRKLLVLLNPHCGEKKTRSTFSNQIEPLLRMAKFEYTLIGNNYAKITNKIKYNMNLFRRVS